MPSSGGLLIHGFVIAILITSTRTAILDPMTVMKDDVSRIKVMMETVGGNFLLLFTINLDIYNHFFPDDRAIGAIQQFVPQQIGNEAYD